MKNLAASEQNKFRGRSNLDDLDEATSSAEESESYTTESKKTEWTNEKHSMYLSSMETSFVNHQLYDSLDSFGWLSRNKCPSSPKISKQTHSASSQFKVFRDGCWSKIDVKKGEPRNPRKNESGVLLSSPWIKHYRPSKHHMETALNLQEQTPIPAPMNYRPGSQFTLHQESSDSAEGTDQNFVDEDLEAEMPQRTQSVRRTKTSLASDSSSDQVVPYGKHPLPGDDNVDDHDCKLLKISEG